MRMHRGYRLVGSVVLVVVLSGCGGSPASTEPTPSSTPAGTSASSVPGPTGSPHSPSTPATSDTAEPTSTGGEPTHTPGTIDTSDSTATIGTAADELTAFFAAVSDIDEKLRTAAAAVNAGLGEADATFDQDTIDTIDAAAPWPVANAISPGLDSATEQAVLLVYSDLASRYGALRGGDCVQPGTVPRSSLNADCFVRGHVAKMRMPDDIQVARAAAETGTYLAPDPSSPTAAEVLLRIEYINKANLGCGTMGGFLATEPLPVEWTTEPSGDPTLPPTDGEVNGVRFRATYLEGTGWTVDLLAC